MWRCLQICFVTGCLSAIAAITNIPTSTAGLFDSTVDRLPTNERVALRKGESLVTGEKGKYTARVLVTTSLDTAWEVVTDYSNFAKFLPNVVSSKVISVNKNQKVIEQVDSRQVLLLRVKSRVRSAITETAKSRVDFQLVEGDLKSMKGYWLIEPIATYTGAKATQVLITQVVEAQPKSGTPAKVFYSIFKDSLSNTMGAIKQEVEKRSSVSQNNR
ncbi:cyclase/dehydrase [Tolypothrix bouteillei VB521301]|uniref:Cyclase/dehydrase n=1 Tax=Tolypothrix bouteillei VB521301 TaxID=1479485 RepID=A0A0C1R9V4_9CYAN|nr:cyclase/dehydrase [Tolypothrix bouteillei VB521301]